MIRYENVPYRRWRKRGKYGQYYIAQTVASRRVLKHIGIATRDGKAVTFRNDLSAKFGIYDTISATIED